jgi:hypothetical protein
VTTFLLIILTFAGLVMGPESRHIRIRRFDAIPSKIVKPFLSYSFVNAFVLAIMAWFSTRSDHAMSMGHMTAA